MEMMVCCFSCHTLMTSSFVPVGVQAATLAPVSGFTAGCCPWKRLCYLNVLLSKSSQKHPFLQQKGNRETRISPCQKISF